MRYRLRLDPGAPNTFGSEGSFNIQIGNNWGPDQPIRGYYIDFSLKPESAEWPPYWLEPRERQFHVATAQWGRAYERFLDGEGKGAGLGPRAAPAITSSTSSSGAATSTAAGST